MASEPTTPVRVSKSAANYTPTTQDADLRSQINSLLLKDGHVAKIQETLLHSLHSSPTNWPTLIQTHALSLLRSGNYTTFPVLMAKVLEDIRADTLAQSSSTNGVNGSTSISTSADKEKDKKEKEGTVKGRGERGQSLALPKNVVEEGVRITRESLEAVCEVVE
ncbi:2f6267fa-96f7-4c7e-acfd-4fa60b3dab5e [Sclerotinia trifoliorum]|uniref:2f6267fa-96f7-4c7e-acfd-4fa60b3dab5e n=1 Tax=Sclerotinia trifoliorum TaxID=28548 RepID=A0A8H2VTE9_9HELO|nr:2f6267fa-96f7-4c7e-acfd-4fa60b3dab5e [Sclerotinia trifoliorum]